MLQPCGGYYMQFRMRFEFAGQKSMAEVQLSWPDADIARSQSSNGEPQTASDHAAVAVAAPEFSEEQELRALIAERDRLRCEWDDLQKAMPAQQACEALVAYSENKRAEEPMSRFSRELNAWSYSRSYGGFNPFAVLVTWFSVSVQRASLVKLSGCRRVESSCGSAS